MKIAVVGATGRGGKRMIGEALSRGHEVTAISRTAADSPARTGVTAYNIDIADTPALAAALKGRDAVVVAWRPKPGAPDVWDAIRAGFSSVLAALREAGVKRVLSMGGAGELWLKPGLKNIDRPDFPEAWKDGSRAGAQKLAMLRESGGNLEWTYMHPAHEIFEGERTGTFRLGGDTLVVDGNGDSKISFEDFAVAALDEIENPRHIRKQMTLAY
jgi:hypothetical protein